MSYNEQIFPGDEPSWYEKVRRFKKTLSRRILFFRESILGQTQKEFADMMQVSQGFISEIEQEKMVPGGEFFMSLYAQGFCITYFFTGEGSFQTGQKEGSVETVGERMRYLRETTGKTEEEFALELEITVRTLYLIESNRLKSEESRLLYFSQRLGVPLDWIKNGRGYPPEKTNSLIQEVRKQLKEKKEIIHRLNNQKKGE